jgi:hypothetical protein
MTRMIRALPAAFLATLRRRWTEGGPARALDNHLRADIGLAPARAAFPISPLVKAWLH